MSKLWFRTKRYGWGWYPSTWQGWFVLLVWAVLVVKAALLYMPESPAKFIVAVIIFVILLLLICFWKGEKPGWRWPARHASLGDAGGGDKDVNNKNKI